MGHLTSIKKHIAENGRLITSVDRLDRIFAGNLPANSDGLATARWNLTRDLLLYFAKQDALVVQALMVDARPAAVLAGARAAERLRRLHAMFGEQLDSRYPRPTADQWPQASRLVRDNLSRVRSALSLDQVELHPFLPAQPVAPVQLRANTNFAAQAWGFREKLFPDIE